MSAPNLHPLVVHFPIALLVLAVALDTLDTLIARPPWLVTAAGWLYAAGSAAAVLAYLTGQQAVSAVVLRAEARVAAAAHENWAMAAAGWFTLLTAGRLMAGATAPRQPALRRGLAAAGLLGLALLWQSSDLGGQLVYRHGVGVAPASAPRGTEPAR